MTDRYGREAFFIFHVAPGIVDPNNSTIQNVVSAANAICNPVGLKLELSQVSSFTGSATGGVPYVMQDKAQLNFLDQDGQPHNFKIPGPGSGIFLDGGKSIDLSDSDVATFTSTVIDGATGRGGAAIDSVTSGHRTSNRKRLKR
jgi:hypothetical protein